MTDLTTYSDETSFNTRLRALAAQILDEEAPHLDAPFGREWHQHGLFTAMQANAEVRGMTGTSDDIAACERLGRTWMRAKLAGREA